MKQLGWYALQAAIVIAVMVFYVQFVFPDMEDPPGTHIALIIGIGLAFAVTILILILQDLYRRLSSRLTHRKR